MKTTIKKWMALALIVSPIVAFAGKEPSVTVKSVDSETIVILIHDTDALSLNLADNQGYVLHKVNLEGTGKYQKKFNLKNLPSGSYYLEYESEGLIKTIPVLKKRNEIIIGESTAEVINTPTVVSLGQQIFLNIEAVNQSVVDVMIVDKKNEVLLSEKVISNGEKTVRRYDFSKVPTGTYELKYTSSGRSYSHSISIN